jgi:hypothetical protein
LHQALPAGADGVLFTKSKAVVKPEDVTIRNRDSLWFHRQNRDATIKIWEIQPTFIGVIKRIMNTIPVIVWDL